MKRSFALVAFLAAAAAAALPPAPARAQTASPLLAGVWSLNHSLSELPPDIGFNPAWATAAPSGDGQSAGRAAAVVVAVVADVADRRAAAVAAAAARPPRHSLARKATKTRSGRNS